MGVIVLTNQTNVGLPDAIGEWALDRLMGNPEVDHVLTKLEAAKKGAAAAEAVFVKPEDARPAPPLAPLTGSFSNPVFGEATITEANGGLDVALASTGATLRLDPWNGDIFTLSLVPIAPLEAISANAGPGPMAFAQFQTDTSGKLDLLEVAFTENGQTFPFTRDE